MKKGKIMVEVKTKLNAEAQRQLTEPTLKKIRNCFVILSAIILIVGIIIFFLTEDVFDKIFSLCTCCIVGIMITPLFMHLYRKELKKAEAKNPILSENTISTFLFTEDKIVATTEKDGDYFGNSVQTYATLHKVTETGTLFFIYLNPSQVYLIPKKDITQGTPEMLFELLHTNVKKYIRKLK